MKTRYLATVLAGAILLTPQLALAAGGGFVMNIHGYYIVDFVIFVLALYHFGKKPLQGFLEARRANAAKEIAEASELKAKAEERLARYEKQLASLEETRQELREQFTSDGENEKRRLVAEAENMAERLRRDLDRSVQQEDAKVAEGLELELANKALAIAQSKVEAQLTPGVHQSLVDQFIADLGSIDSLGDFRKAQG